MIFIPSLYARSAPALNSPARACALLRPGQAPEMAGCAPAQWCPRPYQPRASVPATASRSTSPRPSWATRARTSPSTFSTRTIAASPCRQTARDACPSVAEAELRHTGQCRARLLSAHRTGLRCPPVTRLDRDTFGVVLFAKNAYIHEKFCEMQKKHQISKTYHASVYGTKMADFGLIDLADPEAAGKKPSPDCQQQNGKKCESLFCCLARFQDVSCGN